LVSHRKLIGSWVPSSALVSGVQDNYATSPFQYSLHSGEEDDDVQKHLLDLVPSAVVGLFVAWICWIAGLVTPSVLISQRDVLRGRNTGGSWFWWLPGMHGGSPAGDDTEGRYMIRRVLIVDRHGRRPSGPAERGYGAPGMCISIYLSIYLSIYP
jgi:hypothetical protein